MEQSLIIVRGWQGSGKTTFANKLREVVKNFHYPEFNTTHYEADMYFYNNGNYEFEFSKLREAHNWCQESVEKSVQSGVYFTIVSNTFRSAKEILPYLDIANRYAIQVCLYECIDNFQNVHYVPDDIVKKYKKEFVRNIELSKLDQFAKMDMYTVSNNNVFNSITH